MAVEEPVYSVSHKVGACEIRDYPARVAAEVTVTGEREPAINAGFRILAGYIFGGNVSKQKIAMTAPVVQSRQSEKIAMTAPVIQESTAMGWVIRFMMPKAYTLETLPTPTDARVHLVALPETRFAVIRFSGLTQEGDLIRQTKLLEDYMQARQAQVLGPAGLARYDPPWTLWFLRRNELMIPIS